ncbi:MAG: 50S ribosomal protein L30 [Methanobacteriaceae archaeon]|nr:50S ribosomal protein L30 [Methanobacteriaceae archaeon]
MFLVIRVRGTTGVISNISSTLKMLRLNRINHAVLVEENPSFKGMLQKGKDYITWGEIDTETLVELIEKRGKLVGGAAITEEYLAENTDYSSFEELANALINSEIKPKDINMKPVFRLHPPRKGYEGIRHSVNEGGSLGYRGEAINDLAKRMA